jgi:hypothetical protein
VGILIDTAICVIVQLVLFLCRFIAAVNGCIIIMAGRFHIRLSFRIVFRWWQQFKKKLGVILNLFVDVYERQSLHLINYFAAIVP